MSSMPVTPVIVDVAVPIAVRRQMSGPMGETVPHAVPPVIEAWAVSNARSITKSRSVTKTGAVPQSGQCWTLQRPFDPRAVPQPRQRGALGRSFDSGAIANTGTNSG
jgi:hypothetical protein